MSEDNKRNITSHEIPEIILLNGFHDCKTARPHDESLRITFRPSDSQTFLIHC